MKLNWIIALMGIVSATTAFAETNSASSISCMGKAEDEKPIQFEVDLVENKVIRLNVEIELTPVPGDPNPPSGSKWYNIEVWGLEDGYTLTPKKIKIEGKTRRFISGIPGSVLIEAKFDKKSEIYVGKASILPDSAKVSTREKREFQVICSVE